MEVGQAAGEDQLRQDELVGGVNRVGGVEAEAGGATIFEVGVVRVAQTYPRDREGPAKVNGEERACATARILPQVRVAKGVNIILLPVGRLEKAVLTEPTFSKVTVKREWPNRVRVTVTERQPWASVQLPDGVCYTVDETLVPFRKSDEPEKGLPRVLLAPNAQGSVVTLGKTMTAPGLADVSACLNWANARADFPLETVAIDPTGKLCLNRVGGVQIRLGSRQELERKLGTLDLLLARRPDVRDGSGVEYVNLYAYDAPAVMARPPAKPGSPAGKPGAPSFAPSETSSESRT